MPTNGPLDVRPSGPTVVRLNRRIIYVVGAVLIAAFVAGLIAIRAGIAPRRERGATPRGRRLGRASMGRGGVRS